MKAVKIITVVFLVLIIIIGALWIAGVFDPLLPKTQTPAEPEETPGDETVAPTYPEENVMYSSLDNTAVFPERLRNVENLKIVNSEDESIVYYENGAFTESTPNNASESATSDIAKLVKNVSAYDGEKLIWLGKIIPYTKVITTINDLTSLKSTSRNDKAEEQKIYGYYVVANDITYDGNWNPNSVGNDAYGDYFCGTFDGNGKRIEYSIKQAGLFGYIGDGAVIKNAQFIVKEYKSSSVTYGGYTAIAGTVRGGQNPLTLENVYVKYDFDFTPDVMTCISGQSSGLGLFSRLYCSINVKNVIIDMTKVQGVENAEMAETKPYAYGTLCARLENSFSTDGIENLVILSKIPYMSIQRNYDKENNFAVLDTIKNAIFAYEDADLYQATNATGIKKLCLTAHRYNDYASATEKNVSVGNFKITLEGVKYSR